MVEHCIKSLTNCQYTTMGNDTQPLAEAENALIYDKYLPTLQKVLRRIHELAPNAKIMVMGYPELISNNGSCLGPVEVRDPNTGLPLWHPGISPAEAQWMATMAGNLAAAARSAVVTEWNLRNIPGKFIDPRPYFAGLGVCGGPNPAILGVVFTYTAGESPKAALPENPWWRLGISQQSFHPNLAGTSFYAQALITTLRLPEVGL